MPHNEIDRWDGKTYTRILFQNRTVIKVDVRQPDEHRIRVEVHADSDQFEPKKTIVPLLEKMLGIRTDLRAFYRFARKNEQLSGLASRFLGFKPPCFPSVYEAVINAIACQQISLNVAIALLNRITKTWGISWLEPEEQLHSFPPAEALAAATITELRKLGFSANKARAIIGISQEVVRSGIDLENLSGKNDSGVTALLTSLPGIGLWSAEYAMLRGLGRTHIFPGNDSGAQRGLQLLLALKDRPSAEKTGEITRTWHPYAGLLYFHFLLNKLARKGYIA